MSTGGEPDLASLRQSLRPAEAPAAIDVSMWVGTYPFRHIAAGTLEHLRAKMKALRIERGIVSGFECLFAENNLDAYRHWAEMLAGDAALEVWPVVRPGNVNGLERLLEKYRPRGLRLLPNYHGYALSDASLEPIMRLARERNMIVQVFQRIADERWHWMLRTPPVDEGELSYFTAAYADQALLLSGLGAFGGVAARMAQSEQVYVDLSRIRGPVFAIEKLTESVRIDRAVFGSLWPIQMIEPSLWQIGGARISDAEKSALLRDNAARLLASAGAGS